MSTLDCEKNPSNSIAIEDIWFTQRSLKRADQIPAMVACLQGEGPSGLPLIVLHRCEDGEVIVHDGHHRVTAIWLSGRRFLRYDEYVIYDIDVPKRRIARIDKFIRIAAPHLLSSKAAGAGNLASASCCAPRLGSFCFLAKPGESDGCGATTLRSSQDAACIAPMPPPPFLVFAI